MKTTVQNDQIYLSELFVKSAVNNLLHNVLLEVL